MRHEGYHAQRLGVHVLSTSEPYWTRRTDFLPCNRTGRFVSILRALWNPPIKSPISVGVNLQKIIPDAEVTLNMFDDARRVSLEEAIDRLNRRHGRTTITRAAATSGESESQNLRIQVLYLRKITKRIASVGFFPTKPNKSRLSGIF
jgi:hypothetical protein